MACAWGKDALAHVREFATVPAVRDGKFAVYSILWTPNLDQGYDEKWLDELIPLTARLHASLWVAVFGDRAKHERTLTMLQSVADKCRVQNVPLVLYPHAGSTFVDAEEALALIREMNRPEVKLSLHISHELMAGNGPRMEEVIAKVAPYIALASINGVDSAPDYTKASFDITIMPLNQGSYDVRPYVASLVRHGYRGPFLEHTWGFKSPPEQHLAACMQAWQKISADVATQIAAENQSAARPPMSPR
jgi:sugar phosphate isomerase/epimerase